MAKGFLDILEILINFKSGKHELQLYNIKTRLLRLSFMVKVKVFP